MWQTREMKKIFLCISLMFIFACGSEKVLSGIPSENGSTESDLTVKEVELVVEDGSEIKFDEISIRVKELEKVLSDFQNKSVTDLMKSEGDLRNLVRQLDSITLRVEELESPQEPDEVENIEILTKDAIISLINDAIANYDLQNWISSREECSVWDDSSSPCDYKSAIQNLLRAGNSLDIQIRDLRNEIIDDFALGNGEHFSLGAYGEKSTLQNRLNSITNCLTEIENTIRYNYSFYGC